MTITINLITQQQKQDTFDNVVTHLRKQGARAMTDDGTCRYRGPNGTKCAVGFLISDEEYDPVIEGEGIHALANDGICLIQGERGRSFLGRLQDAHDNENDLPQALTEIALDFGLDPHAVTDPSLPPWGEWARH